MNEIRKAPIIVHKNILDLFHKLTDKNSSVRINSCADIISIVHKKQNEAKRNELSTELQYCIERLVKGLASSRDAARLGFSLLLTEILKYEHSVQLEEVIELSKKHLSLSSKLEKREAVFGQLFAYASLVRSGRLKDHRHMSHIVMSMFDLWQGKSYISCTCYEIIVDLFSQLSKERFAEVWPQLKSKLSGGWDSCTIDILWILLLCIRLYPDSANENFLGKKWDNSDILSADNFDHLKKLIKQTTSSLPSLHPLCIEFANLCLRSKDAQNIWNAVIDDNLFDTDQTEKAYLGFEMVKHALQRTQKKKHLKTVLSSKFRTMFYRSFQYVNHPMHPAALHLAAVLCDLSKSSTDPHFQMVILKVFLQPPGTLLSDQILKKKEVMEIIQNLSQHAVKSFFEFLKSIAAGKSDEAEVNNSKRHQAIAQIGSLVCHSAVINDIDWRLDVIKFLFLRSFFTVKEPNADILHCEESFDTIPYALQESFRNAFYKTFSSLYQRSDQHVAPLQHFLQHSVLLTEYADLLMSSVDNVAASFPLEQVQESWDKVKSITRQLTKQTKKDGKTNESNAFLTLFLELAFYLFQDPHHIVQVLEELHICCSNALSARKHSDADSEEVLSWANVLVDILLSLLSQSSHHLRRIVTSVFPLLSPFITLDSLLQILEVINPIKSEGEPMLVEESDDEENLNFESGSSDESDENEPETSKVDEKFRKNVKEALGEAADDSEAESVVLSDSEMFKLDDALAKAFKSRVQPGHSQLSHEDKTMLHFRVRCLDLIIAYLKSEPPMHLVLQCIEPILSAYEYGYKNTNQKPLLNKAVSTLQVLTKIKRFQNLDNVEKSEMQRLLDLLITKCHKESNMEVAPKIYALCVFLVLCFRRLETLKQPEKKSKKSPSYLTTYFAALETFAKGSSSNIYPQCFVMLMETCPDLAWNLIVPCREYAFDQDIRIYKRTQCLGLIFEALKFSKAQSDVSADQWLQIGDSLIPPAVALLKDILENTDMKPVYVTELLDVIFTCNSILKEKTEKSLLDEHTDLLVVLQNMSKTQTKKLTKKGNQLRRKIIFALGGNLQIKFNSKPEIDTTEAEDDTAETINDTTETINDTTETINDTAETKDGTTGTKDVSQSKKRKHKSKKNKVKKQKKDSIFEETMIESS